MGVFEQQHCNYEHLFGQALFRDPMCARHAAGRKDPAALKNKGLSALGGQPGFG